MSIYTENDWILLEREPEQTIFSSIKNYTIKIYNEYKYYNDVNNYFNLYKLLFYRYETYTVKELKDICKERGIKGISNKNKDELISLLLK